MASSELRARQTISARSASNDRPGNGAKAFQPFATRLRHSREPSQSHARHAAAAAWAAGGPGAHHAARLRHGLASIVVEAGVNAKRLQTWMGNSGVATTLRPLRPPTRTLQSESTDRVNECLAAGGSCSWRVDQRGRGTRAAGWPRKRSGGVTDRRADQGLELRSTGGKSCTWSLVSST